MKLRIVLFSFLGAMGVLGKNLENRFGFGVATTDFHSLTALSLRYHFDPFVSTAAQVAFDTDDSNNSTRIGAKICRNVSMEENNNFYLGAALFMIADKKGGAFRGGIELDGLIGMEFFLSGLPSLGLSVETGLALRSLGSVTFRSIGSGFAGAGIHYYF